MANMLVIVGSLRERSFNAQLAREVEALVGDRAHVSFLRWDDVPLLSQDIEDPVPPAVARVRSEVLGADGIWLCSPEYNGNVPGGLKNLLDWLSRPMDPKDRGSASAVRGKVISICGVGGRPATAHVRERLEELLGFMGMRLVGGRGFGLALDAEAWKTDVLTLPDDARAELAGLVDAFLGGIGA